MCPGVQHGIGISGPSLAVQLLLCAALSEIDTRVLKVKLALLRKYATQSHQQDELLDFFLGIVPFEIQFIKISGPAPFFRLFSNCFATRPSQMFKLLRVIQV